MLTQIDELVAAVEEGTISRRCLIARLGALAACMAGAKNEATASQPEASTFDAVGLNHIALSVSDVGRSRDFYKKHLGLTVMRERDGQNCFMRCGEHFVALFNAAEAGLDHYCYTIKEYAPAAVVDKLNAVGLKPRRVENRVYFDDPDGITVQVSARNTRP